MSDINNEKQEEAIRFAKKYLEDILSFFGLNTNVYATCEEDVIELDVPSTHLNGFLIGQRGDTLRSLQYLVSTALKNNDQALTRVNVDVADYKRHRRERLASRAERWIEDVKSSKEAKSLRPMNPADRRVVHKTVGDIGGVESHSEGIGRDRFVIITPMKAEDGEDEDESEKNEEVDGGKLKVEGGEQDEGEKLKDESEKKDKKDTKKSDKKTEDEGAEAEGDDKESTEDDESDTDKKKGSKDNDAEE